MNPQTPSVSNPQNPTPQNIPLPANKIPTIQCPYLSTIRKHLLDFDFQKICSISLSKTNVYACLVCGRYFQGRSSTSPAYQHSIQFSHYIFMNLQNSKIYCLPDDYEVDPYTIRDVKYNLNPIYNQQKLKELQKMQEVSYNIDGRQFVPGVLGMNNLGKTDYANVVLYLFNSVKEIRHFFVLKNQFNSKILSEFSIILRKMWNNESFKGQVSPHEFLQQISELSAKKFKIGIQADPLSFFLWLKDSIQKQLKKQKGIGKLDVDKLFKGKLKTSIIKGIKDSYQYEQIPTKIQQIPFSVLKLQFPEKGIFNKTASQVDLDSLMQKYIGKVGQKHNEGLRYAKIIQFPQYLILCLKRFTNNGYSIQMDNSHLNYLSKLNINSNNKKSQYQLIGQVCYSGNFQNIKYRVQVYMVQGNKWFQIQDLQVKQRDQKDILLGQPYIQMYKLIKMTATQ